MARPIATYTPGVIVTPPKSVYVSPDDAIESSLQLLYITFSALNFLYTSFTALLDAPTASAAVPADEVYLSESDDTGSNSPDGSNIFRKVFADPFLYNTNETSLFELPLLQSSQRFVPSEFNRNLIVGLFPFNLLPKLLLYK